MPPPSRRDRCRARCTARDRHQPRRSAPPEDGGLFGDAELAAAQDDTQRPAVDEYAPSLAELVSLAVAPEAQGRGLGRRLIAAAEALARQRGYAELFAVSLADTLFLAAGFRASSIAHYPEKAARYAAISRSELSIGKKFLFVKRLDEPAVRVRDRRARARR